MQHTDKTLLVKGLRFLSYTVATMFLAPVIIYQAFKNTEHSMYYPVLVVGLLMAIAAIGLGFYTVKIFIDALFGKKK